MALKFLLFLCFLVLLSSTHVAIAARELPNTSNNNSDKKLEKECFDEGTVRIPGIGRYKLGSHEMPSFSGLDHSGPAAANGQYVPGNDDTFVPNPGYEAPNPASNAGGAP